MRYKIIALSFFLVFFFQIDDASTKDLTQLSGVIHIHTTFSSGHYSIEELANKAKEKGLDVLVITDHDLVAMEYGVFPFRNIVKKREERPSVIKLGPEAFLQEIERVNKSQQDVLVIPGVQSSPFYYWSGSPFQKNLTAHDYRKELLLLGMQNPEDYQGLPLLHRGFSTQYVKELLPGSIIFLISFFIAVYLFFQKGVLKIMGGIIGILSLALLINNHPFQSSRFDPYHGDQGIAPFQELIDYVNQRKGLTFWAHPESNYAVKGVPIGPIKLMTKHNIDDLIFSKNYTGFSAIYGDNITATDPGKHWDNVLNEYCFGKRTRPCWGIAGADFHVERGGEGLDTYQTVFLTNEKTQKAVLETLTKGRFYAVRKAKGPRLSLDQFRVIDEKTKKEAISGGHLQLRDSPVIEGHVSTSYKGRFPIIVSLIRGGKVVKSFEGETPLAFRFRDQMGWRGKSYYRLDIKGRAVGKLISNPIFVSSYP